MSGWTGPQFCLLFPAPPHYFRFMAISAVENLSGYFQKVKSRYPFSYAANRKEKNIFKARLGKWKVKYLNIIVDS